MTQKPENHHEGVPVSQAILAKTTVFPAIPKKQFWPKHTALSRFCQHKVISQSKHTVLSSFRKNMTPLGTKQKIHECLLKEALSPFFNVTVKRQKTKLIPVKTLK